MILPQPISYPHSRLSVYCEPICSVSGDVEPFSTTGGNGSGCNQSQKVVAAAVDATLQLKTEECNKKHWFQINFAAGQIVCRLLFSG